MKEHIEQEIREAYIFLRRNNKAVSSETFQFMLDASIEKLNQVNNIDIIKEPIIQLIKEKINSYKYMIEASRKEVIIIDDEVEYGINQHDTFYDKIKEYEDLIQKLIRNR